MLSRMQLTVRQSCVDSICRCVPCHMWHTVCFVFSLCSSLALVVFFFFFNDTATTEIYTLSLHDALPIYRDRGAGGPAREHADHPEARYSRRQRSEEHTSELQSRLHLVCRLLLEKKKKKKHTRLEHEEINMELKERCTAYAQQDATNCSTVVC